MSCFNWFLRPTESSLPTFGTKNQERTHLHCAHHGLCQLRLLQGSPADRAVDDWLWSDWRCFLDFQVRKMCDLEALDRKIMNKISSNLRPLGHFVSCWFVQVGSRTFLRGSVLVRQSPTRLYWTLAPRRRRFTVRSMCALGWRSLWLGLYQQIPTVARHQHHTSLGRTMLHKLKSSLRLQHVLEQTGQIGGTIPQHFWSYSQQPFIKPGVPRRCRGFIWCNDVGSSPISSPTHHSPLGHLSGLNTLAILGDCCDARPGPMQTVASGKRLRSWALLWKLQDGLKVRDCPFHGFCKTYIIRKLYKK